MKKLTLSILVLLALTLAGCGGKMKSNSNLIYGGSTWNVIKLNDSIVLCTPGINASNKLTPVVINLHDLNGPCYKDNHVKLD